MANVDDFVGPFVGSGITGYNDIAYLQGETASSCIDKCRADPRCKSVDYGAREQVQGECILSTADRFSAASAFENTWALYDYYERASASKDKQAVNSASMAKALPTTRNAELLNGQMQLSDCCANPEKCIDTAIIAGVPVYNGGDHLGCFVIYHAAAEKLGQCEGAAMGMMQATAKMSEMDAQAGNAAWRLRHAFDSYRALLSMGD
jgi:hypothetical protein